MKKVKIQCSNRQYNMLIQALRSACDGDRCFLGKTGLTCPALRLDTTPKQGELTCKKCLQEYIERVEL